MARKWGSPKQLKALKKLIAARRAMVRGKGGKASKARRTTTPRKRNPLRALIANPGSPARLKLIKRRVKARRAAPSTLAPKRRKRRAAPRKVTRRKTAKRRTTTRRKVGVSHMAKKRRRRAGTRRITRAVRVPKRYARKYIKRRGSKRRFYINPRRRSHRRNPGLGGSGGLLKSSLVSLGAGFISAGVAAVIDKYANGRPMIARVGKLVAALAIAKFGGRYPRAASAAIGGLAASEGYNMVTKMIGGMASAQSEADKIKALADAAKDSPAVSALLDGGMGALLNGVPDVSNSAFDYNTALSNMAGDADDDDSV